MYLSKIKFQIIDFRTLSRVLISLDHYNVLEKVQYQIQDNLIELNRIRPDGFPRIYIS